MSTNWPLLILALIIHLSSAQLPSPCPDIFTYQQISALPNQKGRWNGTISLQTDDDLEGIWLKIGLDHPAEALGNWFGDSTTEDNRHFSIRNKDYVLKAGPPVQIHFFVDYSTERAVPSVRKILLNGRTICNIRREAQPTTPKLHISYQVTPTSSTFNTNSRPGIVNPDRNNNNRRSSTNPRNGYNSNSNSEVPISNDEDTYNSRSSTISTTQNNFLFNSNTEVPTNSQNSFNNNRDDGDASTLNSGMNKPISLNNNGIDFFPGDFNLNRPIALPTVRPPSSTCGIVALKPTPLVSGGTYTKQGQWPWHAALYTTGNGNLSYQCGGTLISAEYVLTAAHCVTGVSNRPLNTKQLSVYFGKYSLKRFGNGVQQSDIASILVHPAYNTSNFANDIAILRLEQPVEFGDFVRPCCLWEEEVDISRLENQMGTVVGWSFNDFNQLSDLLMHVEMPIIKKETCIYSYPEFFAKFTNENNYCAGFQNKTGVCNGDSGGAMVFPKRGTSGQNTVWQVRGIVSISVAKEGHCDLAHYVVMTDVANYLRWIRKAMNQ